MIFLRSHTHPLQQCRAYDNIVGLSLCRNMLLQNIPEGSICITTLPAYALLVMRIQCKDKFWTEVIHTKRRRAEKCGPSWREKRQMCPNGFLNEPIWNVEVSLCSCNISTTFTINQVDSTVVSIFPSCCFDILCFLCPFRRNPDCIRMRGIKTMLAGAVSDKNVSKRFIEQPAISFADLRRKLPMYGNLQRCVS